MSAADAGMTTSFTACGGRCPRNLQNSDVSIASKLTK